MAACIDKKIKSRVFTRFGVPGRSFWKQFLNGIILFINILLN